MDSGVLLLEILELMGWMTLRKKMRSHLLEKKNNNLLEKFNGGDLVGELCNNQQPEGAQLRNNLLRNDLPVGLNNRIMVPQTPAVAVAPYQAYLATGSLTWPPFIANCSAGKFSAEDYYQQMIMSRMERQEIEEQERARH